MTYVQPGHSFDFVVTEKELIVSVRSLVSCGIGGVTEPLVRGLERQFVPASSVGSDRVQVVRSKGGGVSDRLEATAKTPTRGPGGGLASGRG